MCVHTRERGSSPGFVGVSIKFYYYYYRQFNPLNPPGQFFLKVRVSIRTCMPNLGVVRRERFLTIDNPLNRPGVWWGWSIFFFLVRVSIRTCVPNLGAVCRERFLTIDNPLNPPGVWWGWSIFFKVSIYPHMRAKFGRGLSRKIFNDI